MVCISSPTVSSEILPVGYLKGQYKSESSLMTCEAELHGSVTPTRMPSSILSLIGNYNCCSILLYFPRPRPRSRVKPAECGWASESAAQLSNLVTAAKKMVKSNKE